MILRSLSSVLPRTLDEFQEWESVDGYKYEWNDGKIIRFGKLKKRHLFIIRRLQQLFFRTVAFSKGASLVMEQDVMLSGIQMRRPDLAYFNKLMLRHLFLRTHSRIFNRSYFSVR